MKNKLEKMEINKNNKSLNSKEFDQIKEIKTNNKEEL